MLFRSCQAGLLLNLLAESRQQRSQLLGQGKLAITTVHVPQAVEVRLEEVNHQRHILAHRVRYDAARQPDDHLPLVRPPAVVRATPVLQPAFQVAGEHGKPSYGAFNVEYLNRCRVEVDEYQMLAITGEALAACETEEEVFDRLEMLLNLGPQDGTFWVGGDLGYTNDPTELVVFRETQDEGKSHARLVLRIHMEHVAYPHIAQVLALLEHYYAPMGIGVDQGGNGLAVVQELTALDKYRELQLDRKLHGYDFGGMVTVAVRDDGRLLKKRTKEYMTSLINRGLQRRELLLPSNDLEIEDQFTTHTYTLANGKVIYSKGNDHIVDAVRCAMLVRDQERLDEVQVITPRVHPVMTDPVFW